MNEPSKAVGIDLLKTYYTQAYSLVRKASPCAIISIEGIYGPWDVMDTINEPNVIVESHFYDVFNGADFKSAQEEIYYIRSSRVSDIKSYQKAGRNLLIGEFSNAMGYGSPSPSEQKEFSLAQMQVFAGAKAGWFFWSLKINKPGTPHWDLRLSIANGWMPKKPNGQWY
eukprot:TRINITY_DN13820_c0_g1_i4.p1 TRINITY_DN13820_c0_g1~~TRINITY_DN13820_c0_g1_i4.p1  ORF type:complete len:169 (+),score=12.01 TRINITY_DN13820_c0_g1_i4:2-508(+)